MNTLRIRVLGIFGLLLTSTVSVQGNDIVDFLRAINGASDPRDDRSVIHQVGQHDHGDGGMHGGEHGDRNLSSRDIYKRNTQFADRDMNYLGYSRDQGQYNRSGFDPQRVDLRYGSHGNSNYGRSTYGQPNYPQRSGAQFSFRVSSNNGGGYGEPLYIPSQEPVQVLPPVQELPPVRSYAPAPPYPVVPVSPHQVGEIVDCRVPLATCVRIEDECNIAPHAVPVVVAVRDPATCGHQCHERIVFVEVFVPPCPPRLIRVSPCHSRVTMDFGEYQVDLKSQNGIIVIDYDN